MGKEEITEFLVNMGYSKKVAREVTDWAEGVVLHTKRIAEIVGKSGERAQQVALAMWMAIGAIRTLLSPFTPTGKFVVLWNVIERDVGPTGRTSGDEGIEYA